VEIILGPDVVEMVADWLRDNLPNHGYTAIFVGSDIPRIRPDTFVTVNRTGGFIRSHVIDDAQITVNSWGATDPAAHDLAQWCRGLVFAMAGRTINGHKVYQIAEFTGPVLLPDVVGTDASISGQPRFRSIYQVSVRCTATA
jgi:hypothetical protein